MQRWLYLKLAVTAGPPIPIQKLYFGKGISNKCSKSCCSSRTDDMYF